MSKQLDLFPEGQKEHLDTPCPRCQKKITFIKKVKMHIGLYCDICGWIKWMEQDWKTFIMPF